MDNTSWAIVLVVVGALVIAYGNLFSLIGLNAGWIIASSPTENTIDYVVASSDMGSIGNGMSWSIAKQMSLKVDGRNICAPTRPICGYWGGSNPYADIPEYDCKCHFSSIKTEVANTVLDEYLTITCAGYTIPITKVEIQPEGLILSVPAVMNTGMPGSVYDTNPVCTISGGVTLTNSDFQTCPSELDFDHSRQYDVQGECIYQTCATDNTVWYSWCNERPTNDLLITGSDLTIVFCGDNVCSSFESINTCSADCTAPQPETPDPFKWFSDIIASIRGWICGLLPDFIC